MTHIIEQNSEIHLKESSAPSLSTAAGGDVCTPQVSHDSPLPSPVGADQTPAHLNSLASRARDYVEAARSANTRKAYACDWKHFSTWCRRLNLGPLPRTLDRWPLYRRLRLRQCRWNTDAWHQDKRGFDR